jgi:hypothetical protein
VKIILTITPKHTSVNQKHKERNKMICSMPQCQNKQRAKGYCLKHYNESRALDNCELCERPSTAFGLCHNHYRQEYTWLRSGEIDTADFWEFVKKELQIV